MKIGDTYVASELIASSVFFLKDWHRKIEVGERVTISQYQETPVGGLFKSDGTPFIKIRFGLKECCEDCRKGEMHLITDEAYFHKCFKTEEEYTAPTQLLLEEKVEEKIPCSMALEAFNEVYGLIHDSVNSSYRVLYFGRFEYSVYRRLDAEPELNVTKLGGGSNGAGYTHYTIREQVPKDLVYSLMEAAKVVKEDAKRVHNIALEIQRVYNSLTKLREDVHV